MLKKHSILLGIIIAMALLLVAAMHYPGGSQHSKTSTGLIGAIITCATCLPLKQ